MKSAELHQAHLSALVSGEAEAAAQLRGRFSADDHQIAAKHLEAAAAVVLEYRFGPGAGLGAGPVDYDELAVFMAEVRRGERGTVPPSDHLAVEAAVRALYGETHLTEPLARDRRWSAHYRALRHETARRPWLAANPGHLVYYARKRMTTWILGRPEE